MQFCWVCPKVRKARGDMADPRGGADVFMYRDSTVALVLDVRRSMKAVLGVIGGVIRSGVTLSRSMEFISQWSCVRWIGPVGPVTRADVRDDVGIGTGAFQELEPGFCVPRWVTLFTGLLFFGWMRAVRGWRNWLLEDPLINSWEWWRLDVVPPAPCLQVEGAFF